MLSWRPDREALVISLRLYIFIDSQTHVLIFLGNLIHILIENKPKGLEVANSDKKWLIGMMADSSKRLRGGWVHGG